MNERKLPSSGPADNDRAMPNGLRPAELLLQYWKLFLETGQRFPVIDLACGKGRNGIFLAAQGIATMLIDRSQTLLDMARGRARQAGVSVDILMMDLEGEQPDPLPELTAAGMLVFRYLHRPLIPAIKKAIVPGGILIYETFTVRQSQFGKPHHPDHLLQPGELKTWFGNWEVIHYFEGTKDDPQRAIAQIVCRKGS